MVRVLVTGSFDKLHPGHLDYFRQAKRHGDRLIVVVARDRTIQREKGKHPLQSERERTLAIKPYADEVILGGFGDPFDILKTVRPDLICLGYDQKVDEKRLKTYIKDNGLKCKIIRLEPYQANIYKSSLIRKAMEDKMRSGHPKAALTNPYREKRRFFPGIRHIPLFILLYGIILTIVGLASGGLIISPCPTCGPDRAKTALFHVTAIVLTYLLFCWVVYAWKMIVTKLRSRETKIL